VVIVVDATVIFRDNHESRITNHEHSMPMTAQEITAKVMAAIPDAVIELKDTAGDNDHWQITVLSAAFAGKTRVAQHRMVMDAIGEGMGTTLHALAISTKIA